MKELIGKTIKSLSVNADQSILSFETDHGQVNFEVWGDCCSTSWFADITGVHSLLDGKVANVEEVSMDGYNVNDGRCRQDEDIAYGYKIVTDKGHADVVFRNSSNGYYGGELSSGPKTAPEGMTIITDDWRA